MSKHKTTLTTIQVLYELSSPMPMSTTTQSSPNTNSRWFLMAQISLRIFVTLLTLAAVLTLITSGQTVNISGIDMQSSYTYSSAFKYKLIADALVCASSFLSLVFVYVLTRPKSNPKHFFYLLVHDLVMVVMVISGCAAGTAIGYVGRYGQDQTAWMPICDRVGKFCHKVLISIALSYLAFVCVFFLTILAAYRLKSLVIE